MPSHYNPDEFSQLHKTVSKSFAMQRKTLVRVLGLEGRVSELESQQAAEEQAREGIDETLDEMRGEDSQEESEIGGTKTKTEPKASSTAEEGGETITQTPTATATDIPRGPGGNPIRIKDKINSMRPGHPLGQLKIAKDSGYTFKKDSGYTSRVEGKDATGDYLSPEERKARFKKTKITGADIKRGSSVGGAEKIPADTTGASALTIRQPSSAAGVKSDDVTPTDAEAERGGALAQPTESLVAPLKNIDNGVNSIVETLKQSNKEDADSRADARKAAEKAARDQKEGKLEGVKGKLATAAQTVLKPVQNIFSRIWDFLKTVLLGRVVMQLFEWFTNPENSKKVASLFRFLKDWWPVIVAGIMAVVGPGIIFTAGLIALLMWGIPKIIEAVKWVGSLFGIGVDKELKTVEGEADKFGKQTSKDVEKEGAALSGDTKEEGGDDTSPPDTQNEQTPAELGDTQKASEDVQSGADKMSEPAAQMAGGGEVPGTGNRDTVPAMLTPGEFVMSKGAVQQYGTDTLAGMNAAAGGTNRPTMGGYRSGGIVNNMSKNSVQNVKGGSRDSVQNVKGGTNRSSVTNYYNGGGIVNMNRFGKGSTTNLTSIGKGSTTNLTSSGPRIHYNGGGIVDMNRFGGDKSILPRIPVQYFKGGGEVGGLPTELGGGGGGTDSLTEQAKTKTVGTWIGDGIQELFGITPKRMRDTNTGMDDSAAKIIKSSPSQIVINPPPTVSPEVVSQIPLEEVNTRLSAQGAPSQDLPEFSASKMRSGSKIKTLGIVV